MRLAAGAERVDLGVRFGPSQEGRRNLEPLLAAIASEDPRFAALRRFAAAWATPGERLARTVPLVFLEFDDETGERVPVPSIFAAVREGTPVAVWASALELLAGAPLAGELRQALDTCVAALPRHSRLLQVGRMIGRPGAPIRLFLAVWKPRVADTLKAIGYPGRADRVLELHETYADWCETALLQLDVGAAIGARLGIEFDAQAPTPELRHAEWRELVDRFKGSGLCATEKAEALLAWPRPASPGALRRDISHLKLVYDGAEPVEAKAYLFEERRGLGPVPS